MRPPRELELAERFKVSRSPVRETLLALEKEGTVIISPYKGAIVKPLSVAEVLDIAELRLAVISLALKPAHRHLSPADFDHAYDLAKRVTRSTNAKDFFEYNCQFWDSIFSKAQRPTSREVFRQLEDRMARYYPLLIKLGREAELAGDIALTGTKRTQQPAEQPLLVLRCGLVAGVARRVPEFIVGDVREKNEVG